MEQKTALKFNPKYYGIVGDSRMIQDDTGKLKKEKNWVRMKESRPTPDHVATISGEWVLPEVSKDEENAQ